jgi:hypothetical protein
MAALVCSQFAGNAVVENAMSASGKLTTAIDAWRSFSVFCSVFVDFISAWTSARQDAIAVALAQLFRVLPVRTPSLLAGVVQLLRQLVT